MKQAKEFLELFLAKNTALSRCLEEHIDIFSLWPEVLSSLNLEILAQNSWVLDFQKHILTIGVAHSVFLQDLKLQQAKWQKALEQALEQERILKVRYRLQNKS